MRPAMVTAEPETRRISENPKKAREQSTNHSLWRLSRPALTAVAHHLTGSPSGPSPCQIPPKAHDEHPAHR